MKSLDRMIEKLLEESHSLVLDGGNTDMTTLKRIMESESAGTIDLKRYHLDPAGKPYGRNKLVNNGRIEIVFLTWGPGQICDVHDHGESCGMVKVVKGNISNIIYSPDTETGEPIHQQEEYVVDDVFIEVPKDSWHQMKNNLDDFTYTLHVYAPPVEDMQVFDREKKQLITVDEECGAWTTEPEHYMKVVDLPVGRG